VARILADLGADVIDADAVARDVLAPGSEQIAEVVARFGSQLLLADGSIDRPALGRIVFSDPAALADLEAILHPATRRRILDRAAVSPARVVVIEAIKLLEGPLVDHVDAIWVVTAPREVRIERLMADRGMSLEDATRRVDAQNPEADKVRAAHVVLRNEGSLADLRRQTEAAWAAIPLADTGVRSAPS
jgi:dephospho-CoA kinase